MLAIVNPVLPGLGSLPGEVVLGNIISAVAGLFLVGGSITAFLYLLLGALNWITAAGDKTKLEKAQHEITQAIIGLIILVSVWALMLVIGKFTGIGFPTILIPTVNQVSTGGGSGGTGTANCGCYNGGCASVGILAPQGSLGNNTFGPCFTCTATGWVDAGVATCAPVTCGACQ